MELKRKQDEEDRKRREKEEKVIQVWTTGQCVVSLLYFLAECCGPNKPNEYCRR